MQASFEQPKLVISFSHAMETLGHNRMELGVEIRPEIQICKYVRRKVVIKAESLYEVSWRQLRSRSTLPCESHLTLKIELMW